MLTDCAHFLKSLFVRRVPSEDCRYGMGFFLGWLLAMVQSYGVNLTS